MRVTVLTGGASPERAVAFAGAAQVVAALRGRGHEVHVVDIASGAIPAAAEATVLSPAVGRTPPNVAELVEQERRMLTEGLAALAVVQGADVLFLVVHGGYGEGGVLQALLEVIGVPYTGSGPLASGLAVHKDMAKRLFRSAGVPVPEWFVSPPAVAAEDVAKVLGWPVIVKPVQGGSTVGLSLVKQARDLQPAMQLAARYDREVMVEQFIPGRELTVGILGDVPLPVGEIIPRHELFDYECKYTPGMSEEVFPAKLAPRVAQRAQELALAAHRALRLGGHSRIDFRLGPAEDIFCLEANNLPGLTGTSLFPQAARAAGMDYAEMCERLCQLARNTGAGGRE